VTSKLELENRVQGQLKMNLCLYSLLVKQFYRVTVVCTSYWFMEQLHVLQIAVQSDRQPVLGYGDIDKPNSEVS